MSEGFISRRAKFNYEYTLLADVTVGSNTTNIDLTGLNLVKGEEYILMVDLTADGSTELRLFINGNVTTTNYYYQRLSANATTVDCSRANSATFLLLGTAAKSMVAVGIKLLETGQLAFEAFGLRNYTLTNNQRIENLFGTSTFTATSITSIQISSSTANRINTGSRFQLYKRGK